MALDEIEAIEVAYTRISQEVPPRFSISTVSSSRLRRKVDDWEVLLDPNLKLQLDALGTILKDIWNKAPPNSPMAVATSATSGASLLSLDGGGVKGVSSLRILEEIMKKVWKIKNPQADYPGAGADMQVHHWRPGGCHVIPAAHACPRCNPSVHRLRRGGI